MKTFITRTPENTGQTITTNEQLAQAVADRKQIWWNSHLNPLPAACLVCMQYQYVVSLLNSGTLRLYIPKKKA